MKGATLTTKASIHAVMDASLIDDLVNLTSEKGNIILVNRSIVRMHRNITEASLEKVAKKPESLHNQLSLQMSLYWIKTP